MKSTIVAFHLAALLSGSAVLYSAETPPAEVKLPEKLPEDLKKQALEFKKQQAAVREFMQAGKYAEAEQVMRSLIACRLYTSRCV